MLRSPRRLSIALGVAALLAAAAVACTSNDAPAREPTASIAPTTPTATQTAPPSATPWPQGVIVTPTALPTVTLADSRAIVDEVIEAVTTGDVDHLESLIRYQDNPCDGEKGNRKGPPDPDCQGAPLSTLVPAFPAGVCNSVWHRDARPMLERFVERAGPLYAVIEGPGWSTEWFGGSAEAELWDYRVIFEASPVGVTVAATAVIADGRVTILVLGCGSPNTALLPPGIPPPTVLTEGTNFVEPTLRPPRVPTPIEEVRAPSGGRTGLAEIDLAIEAIERDDQATIRQLLRTTPQTCSFGFGLGGAPCEEGQAEGDIVERFPSAGGCEGGWFAPDLDDRAKSITRFDAELFAVAAPSGPSGWTTVFFVSSEAPGGFSLSLDGGAIVDYSPYSCGTTVFDRVQWHDIILRGPAWPAA